MKRQDGSRAIPPENRFIKRFIGFIMVFAMVLAITSITAGSLAAAELSPERQAAVVQSDNPAAGAAQNLIPDETPDQTADLKPGQGTADQELATDQATGQTSDQPLALDQTTWQTSDQPLATDQTTWQTSGQPLATDQTTGQTSGQPLTIDTTPQPLNEDQPAGQTADAAAASAAAAQADLSSQTAIAPAGAAIVPLDAPLDTWTVTFDTAGGSDVPAQDVPYGLTAARPDPDPVREGYTFTGWYKGSASAAYNFSAAVNASFTLTAKWTPITYTVTFDSQGGTAVAAKKAAYGAAIAAPKNPTKAGNTFLGWTLDGAAYDFASPVYSDITLTASWDASILNIVFDSAGGSDVPAQQAEYGSLVQRPADPVREGYTFGGWYYGVYAYTFTKPATFEFTLTARWTQITYIVTFDSQGGTAVAPRKVSYGAAVAAPGNPSKAGNTFAGWTLGGAAYDFSTPVYSDFTLTASWNTGVRTVTFDSAGGSPVPSQSVLYGSKAEKPANPTREGYTFAGWYYGIYAYTFTGAVTFDFTLTA
ncbi:MAG: InlB B-repeat-containing protein, partial [Firmicutes bacterium]|nr:InlB B-repeat-containing protein [Bacillota bacterium]